MDTQSAPPAAAGAAGLGRRICSLCYEGVLVTAILFIGGWVFLFFSRGIDPVLTRPLFQLYLLAITTAYFLYCWTHGGQTLPMKTWRMRLVTHAGGRISLRIGLRRYVFALLGVGLCGFGVLWAFVDRERLFLHDRLAGTRIVRC